MARDRFRYFRLEARELLDRLQEAVVGLARDGASPERVGNALRAAHTLKGAAGVVQAARISERAHRIEDALDPYRETAGRLPEDALDVLRGLLDEVEREVAGLGGPGAAGAPTPAEAPEPSLPAETLESVRVEIEEIDRILAGAVELRTALEEVRRRSRSTSAGGADDALEVSLERALREVEAIRDRATRLRLLPARTLFTRLERAAQEAARTVAKEVRFDAAGGDVRLDAHVLAGLLPGLVHVVRNSVDHGIETRERRILAGKPPAGRIEVRVERRGDRATFACADDGRGLDLEAVRRRAKERGLAPSGDDLDEAAALEIAFQPGFTTSAEVTALSGRGLGLDVLRRIVGGLDGRLRASSEPGRGMRIELDVPISISALRVVAVQAGGRIASIPLGAVREVLSAANGSVVRSPAGDSIVHGSEWLPVAGLTVLLGAPAGRGRGPGAVLVLESGLSRAALAVDAIRGVEEVVVRPTPRRAGPAPLVSGASFDAGGTPRLVLDPAGLVAAILAGGGASPEVSTRPRPPILIVDDSLTTRMLEQSILESAGYEVDVATSGEEALVKARTRPYGLFLVDVEMPGMNGYELLERFRDDPELRRVPSVLVTTRSGPEDRRRGEEAGARAHIAKNEFDERFLLATIEDLLR